jgi:triosephosphate isomerase
MMAGNWKMNLGPSAACAYIERFTALHPAAAERTVIFFPPALSLAAVRDALGGRAADIQVGVQNVYWEESGAFTGELSAPMAADAGAAFVLVGHSERRHLFGETIEDTVRKVRAVLAAGLMPVLCVGETIEERRAGRQEAVVAAQLEPVLATLEPVLATLEPADAGRLLVAYEPVWAIGTGETASPADAAAMHAAVRGLIAARFGDEAAARIPILYGGSVKPDNAGELLAEPNVDGVLVGGASLDPAGFAAICAAPA